MRAILARSLRRIATRLDGPRPRRLQSLTLSVDGRVLAQTLADLGPDDPDGKVRA